MTEQRTGGVPAMARIVVALAGVAAVVAVSMAVSASRARESPRSQEPVIHEALPVGQPMPGRFIGVNRYNLLTVDPSPGGSYRGCGESWTDADLQQWFSEIRRLGVGAVRFGAQQLFTDGGNDFSRMDYLLALAAEHGVRLIPVLENQWEDCTEGGYKYSNWYRTGYRSPDGSYPLSYRDYVPRIVGRYRDSAHILMWELVNEAEGHDRDGNPDPEGLYAFVAEMSASVKAVAPTHLVGFSAHFADQVDEGWYRRLHEIPTVDVLHYHDYDNARAPLPPGLAARFGDARALNKPLVVTEAGIKSGCRQRDCYSGEERADLFKRKMQAFFAEGGVGYVIWHYRDVQRIDAYEFTETDPLANVIATYPLIN